MPTKSQQAKPATRRRRATAAKPKLGRVEARAAACQTTYKHSAKARRELDRFVAFCALVGLRIEPFQRLILLEVFDGRRELVVLIPRGNGKTTLFAALALWHLLTHPAPRVYVAAASKDQADLAFEAARDFARAHPALRKRIKVKFRRLERTDGAGFLKVISSDAGRQHGLMPTLVLVDELHAHKNGDLYVALKTAMGKNPEAQLVTISTAGHDEEETLGELRRRAFSDGAVEPEAGERLRIARIAAANFCLLEWACREDDDLTDAEVIKLANPATFVSIAFLLEQINSPGLHPVELATYHANVWRSGIDSWLASGAWAACLDEEAAIEPGSEVWVGVDMGRRADRGAIVVVAVNERDEDGYITDAVIEGHVFEPTEQPDGVLAFSTIEQAIRDLTEYHDVQGVAYDPWRFDRSAELLTGQGILMVQHDQTDARMGRATQWLYEAINRRRVHHAGDQVLAAHINACHAVPLANGGFRLKKDPRAKKPVDAGHALCNAFSIATELDTAISPYSYGGL